MQHRRFRPGDVLDDYCPRERRITDHAIVAMIDDEIRQTRCGICDAEHEYKEGKVPAPRRKTQPPALFTQVLDRLERPDAAAAVAGAVAAEPVISPTPSPNQAPSTPPLAATDAAGAADPSRTRRPRPTATPSTAAGRRSAASKAASGDR